MRICLAQTQSERGNIHKNIRTHLQVINRAIQFQVDLILFPELSITNYEPDLAKQLATTVEDTLFDPFQRIADKNNLGIGIGMPTKAVEGINIGMLIFQAHQQRLVYSKRLLHHDELPFFVSGKKQPFLKIKGKKIALGICYETLQREHFIHAVTHKADIYIASVAKPARGTTKAYLHFPAIAKEFNIPVLMSNCIGPCDNFSSNGKSTIWDAQGALLGQLDEKHQGILVYDTSTKEVIACSFEC